MYFTSGFYIGFGRISWDRVQCAGPFVDYPSGEHNYLVRVKTSITLPSELISRLDRLDKNRSAVPERAALAYLAQMERQARDRRDIEIIDRHAERLNREAMDALEYQKLP